MDAYSRFSSSESTPEQDHTVSRSSEMPGVLLCHLSVVSDSFSLRDSTHAQLVRLERTTV